MARPKTLYQSAVAVSEEFLGPAGERFMSRQIVTHLNIDPERLQIKHLKPLVKWVRLTFAVLTNDLGLVDDFSERLLELAPKQARKPRITKAPHGSTK